MSINPTPRIVTDFKPKFEIKVDLDERCFLFPSGKSVSQLLLLSDGRTVFIDAVFSFNQSRTPPRRQHPVKTAVAVLSLVKSAALLVFLS
jgi:hypothetical protein